MVLFYAKEPSWLSALCSISGCNIPCLCVHTLQSRCPDVQDMIYGIVRSRPQDQLFRSVAMVLGLLSKWRHRQLVLRDNWIMAAGRMDKAPHHRFLDPDTASKQNHRPEVSKHSLPQH